MSHAPSGETDLQASAPSFEEPDLFDEEQSLFSEESPPSSEEPAPVARDSRSTVSVDFKIPDWVQHLSQLETEEIRDWLVSCPIDHLALALVDTDMSLADTFLSKLEGPRKTAVELQMEWGRLLPPEERQVASQAILERLRRH